MSSLQGNAGASGDGQSGASTLAAIHYEALSAAASTGSSLWGQLKSKLPELRNATQYYANEVQKYGTSLMGPNANGGDSAAGAAAADGSSSGDRAAAFDDSSAPRDAAAGATPEGGSATAVGSAASSGTETEVHYHPSPSGTLGVTVHSVHIETVPTGEMLLTMSIETGFAVFEVTSSGVYEIAVELSSVPGGGPVVAVLPLTLDVIMVATQSNLLAYSTATRTFSPPFALPCLPSGMQLMRSSTPHVTISTLEFAQIFIYRLIDVSASGGSEHGDDATIPSASGINVTTLSFKEVVSICGDRPVLASSPHWLAYSGQQEDAVTEFTAHKAESRAETMAKSVVAGLATLTAGVWGTTPSLQPSAVPLGTVALYDVLRGGTLASFGAHNHPLQCMAFDATGTLLATASTAGTSVNVFQIMPTASHSREGLVSPVPQSESDSTASDGPRPTGTATTNTNTAPLSSSVALLYRLSRGMTQCTITDLRFGAYNRWVAVCTAVGTCHYYSVPEEERRAHGRLAKRHSAPALGPQLRARSAPSATPVNPKLCFASSVFTSGGQVEAVDTAVVSATGTVSFIRCQGNGKGGTLHYNRSIDAFGGPRRRHGGGGGGTGKSNRAGDDTSSCRNDSFNSLPGGGAASDVAAAGRGVTAANCSTLSAETVAMTEEEADALWRAEIELITHDEEFLTMQWSPSSATQGTMLGSTASASSGTSTQPQTNTSSASTTVPAPRAPNNAPPAAPVRHFNPNESSDDFDCV